MKIAVIAAGGKVGRLVVDEALARGHEVVAIVRGRNRSAAPEAIIRDIMDIEAKDLAGFDAVVDAFGTVDPDLLHLHVDSVRHLVGLLAETSTRLYVVGGAGSMVVDDAGTRLFETPEFPDAYVPLSSAQSQQLDFLREDPQAARTQWVFISPAAEFNPDGERTGHYTLVESDEFTVAEGGGSEISYADFALGLVELIEAGTNLRRRVNLRY